MIHLITIQVRIFVFLCNYEKAGKTKRDVKTLSKHNHTLAYAFYTESIYIEIKYNS